MRTQLQIHFHGVDTSPALEASIREKSSKLEQFHPNVTGCRVVVARPHQHKHQGEHFIVSIDVAVPGGKVIANHAGREDVHVALRDAFFAARRQLDEHARRLRGDGRRRPDAARNGAAVAQPGDVEAADIAASADAGEIAGSPDGADGYVDETGRLTDETGASSIDEADLRNDSRSGEAARASLATDHQRIAERRYAFG